jgi:hypothetical protein
MTVDHNYSERRHQVIDLEKARRRRLLQRIREVHGPWWNTWFLPRGENLERLTPEELRRGGFWSPVVERGRRNGADLGLLGRHAS